MQTTTLRRAGIAAVATAALVAPLAQATGAEQPTGARAPAVGETGRSIIHGQVVDSRTGRALDDVEVTALRVTKREQVVAATDLSYASPDNEIEHGYFAMHVTAGTYEVVLTRAGYRPSRVEVVKGKRDRAGLGTPVELVALPRPTVELSTSGSKGGLTVRAGSRVELAAQLRAKGGSIPTGPVQVSLEQPKKGTAAATDLRRSDRGRFVVELGRVRTPGRYDVVVDYAGDDAHRATSSTFTLRVVKKKG